VSYNSRVGDQFLEQPNRATAPAGLLPGKHEAERREAAGDALGSHNDQRSVRSLGSTRQTWPHVAAVRARRPHTKIEGNHGKPTRSQEQLRTAQSLEHGARQDPEQAPENHPSLPDGFRVQRVGRIDVGHHLPTLGGGRKQRERERGLARRERAAQLAHPPARQAPAEHGIQRRGSRCEPANRFGGGGTEPDRSWKRNGGEKFPALCGGGRHATDFRLIFASGQVLGRDQGIQGSRDPGIKRFRDQEIQGSRDPGVRNPRSLGPSDP